MQSGRDSATKDDGSRQKGRERERERETLSQDEARIASLLSRAELITSRTAERAKQQSRYLSRIDVRVHALGRQILDRGSLLSGQAVRRMIHHIVEKHVTRYDNVPPMID